MKIWLNTSFVEQTHRKLYFNALQLEWKENLPVQQANTPLKNTAKFMYFTMTQRDQNHVSEDINPLKMKHILPNIDSGCTRQ
jgi:hypothetical protein